MYLMRDDNGFSPRETEAIELHASLVSGEVISVKIIHAPTTAVWNDYAQYHAGLLPEITSILGERDKWKVHLILKREFLYKAVNNIDEIDPRHFKGVGIFRMGYQELFNIGENFIISFAMLTKHIIIISKKSTCGSGAVLAGYVPSLSTLNNEELKEYIKQIKNKLYVDLQVK